MIYRIDVTPRGSDPAGQSARRQIAEMGLQTGEVFASRIFLLDSDANAEQIRRIANELLADPIVETAMVFDPRAAKDSRSRIEVHLKSGVMDPVAASTGMAIRDLGIPICQARTGRAYIFSENLGRDVLAKIASAALANGVIETVHFDAYLPNEFASGKPGDISVRRVPLIHLGDAELMKLSRSGHLFLSLAEMKAIQNYFANRKNDPTDIELETIAQTWSEHCVHKTLKSAVEVEARDEKGNVIGRRKYSNLIADTIFASTMQLMKEKADFCLSVFSDNAGVIAFDESDAVCFKVETHNHPSAIEPYGGSATGAGGVIRDVLGTGLAAKPVANTDVFCVAPADTAKIPRGVIHPRRVLQQVVAGVRDYGNRMGIPTVNGAVFFDPGYLANPLVFCGCVGLIPRDKISKSASKGDAIVLMGGRTGRDGIHGATFSSAQVTDTHADEFSHAVQIGNAITEQKMAEVILQARDCGLFTAITDCGAGGLSSAVGEMGEHTGAVVDLEKVPLKYQGLRYDEIWISEAQERMVMSVPRAKIGELLKLAASEDVQADVIGEFSAEDEQLVLRHSGTEVGRLSMHFLHKGIPMPTRKAVVKSAAKSSKPKNDASIPEQLLRLLADPNIASKHWIIRQYDHEVQGGSVVKPLTGPLQIGPSDAAVLRPKLDSHRGVALGCGLVPHIDDPYEMALASIDEAIRNVVAVGADPDRVAILDNFCWPSVDDEVMMGTLVRACEACHDAALAYRIPFISGKDSLHNQFTNTETGEILRIRPTLLISAIGVIDDVRRCVTMDLKKPGNTFTLIRTQDKSPAALAALHRRISADIRAGRIVAAHDVSEGGPLVAAAEMCIASGLGLDLDSKYLYGPFEQRVGEYLVEWDAQDNGLPKDRTLLGEEIITIGTVTDQPQLTDGGLYPADRWKIAIDQLTQAWRGTLDW